MGNTTGKLQQDVMSLQVTQLPSNGPQTNGPIVEMGISSSTMDNKMLIV